MTNQSLPDGFDQAMQKKSVGNFSQKYNCLENQNCSFKVKDCIRWCDTLLSTRSSNWTLWFQIKSFKNASHLIKNIGICTGNLCRYTTIVWHRKIGLKTLVPLPYPEGAVVIFFFIRQHILQYTMYLHIVLTSHIT